MVAQPREQRRADDGDSGTGWTPKGDCEFRRDGDEFLFRWPGFRVGVRVFGIRDERGETHVRLHFRTMAGGHIHIGKLNLWSTTARKSLVSSLNEAHTLRHQDAAEDDPHGWNPLVERMVNTTLAEWTKPPAMTDLVAAAMEPRPPAAGELFKGFLPARETSCLYADGGHAKSLTGMALLVARLTGRSVGPYIHPNGQGPAVLLDFESTRDEQIDRLLAVARGMGLSVSDLPLGQFHYHRLFRPIWEEADWLRSTFARMDDPFVVIDSIAYACGGESAVNDDTATRATNTLASFENATRLFLAHVPAATTQNDYKGKIRPYGSTFWYNGARCMWRVQKSKDVLPHDGLALGLFNEKYNNRSLKPPIGVRVKFEGPEDGPPHAVRFEGWSVDGDPSLITHLSNPKRIRALLSRNGEMSTKELADELDTSESNVRSAISRMKDVDAVTTSRGGTGNVSVFRLRSARDDG